MLIILDTMCQLYYTLNQLDPHHAHHCNALAGDKLRQHGEEKVNDEQFLKVAACWAEEEEELESGAREPEKDASSSAGESEAGAEESGESEEGEESEEGDWEGGGRGSAPSVTRMKRGNGRGGGSVKVSTWMSYSLWSYSVPWPWSLIWSWWLLVCPDLTTRPHSPDWRQPMSRRLKPKVPV